jgi:hypothetical protein
MPKNPQRRQARQAAVSGTQIVRARQSGSESQPVITWPVALLVLAIVRK